MTTPDSPALKIWG